MTKIDELKKEIKDLKEQANNLKLENKIDAALELVNTIKDKKEELRKLEEIEDGLKAEIPEEDEKIKDEFNKELSKEEKKFVNLIKNGFSNDMKAGEYGSIIPSSISSKIIAKVEEISPIYSRTTKYNVAGDLTFILEDKIPTCEYMEEMEEGTPSDATFKTIKLGAFIARTVARISRSLINKTDFDILNYVVNAVAKSISNFLEKELIVGTSDKIDGLSKIEQTEVDTINADALIDAQMGIPTVLQGNCEWLMNPEVLKTLRKLKASDGTYLLNTDLTKEFGWALLGKGILISDQVPKNTIFYGDFSGLHVKLTNNIEVSVLKEKYAEQYAIGIVGFVELDAKVVEPQKIVAVKKQGA